jgi:hypothetical protein
MSLSRIAIVSSVLVAALVAFPGCKKLDTSDGESLGTSEDLLVTDSEGDDEQEQSEESAEDSTTGASTEAEAEQGPEPSASADLDAQMVKVRENPGRFFTPAGCITTTIEKTATARIATHVFQGCLGPEGKRKYTGTVVATWTAPGAGKLQVVREAKGFKIERIDDGVVLTVDRTVTVSFAKAGTVYSKVRSVQMTGTTSTGKNVSRTASWNVSFDSSTRCLTRDGSSTATHEGRELTRTVTGYKRCGIGTLGCPQSGVLTINRKKGVGDAEKDLTLTVEFTGGRGYAVTGSAGRKVSRNMNWCRIAAEK